jgi:NAD(P)-dependent dehydrogenase (short-subunit alcohol dehydrogenase family)
MTSILITGIARGIGFELARQALDKGWEVAGSVRSSVDRERLQQLLPQATVLQFDVTDFAAIDKAAAAFQKPIDILINNAGIITPARQSTTDMDFEGFAQTLQVNTLAPLKVSQAFLPNLKKGSHSRLITISSGMGLMQHAKSDRIAYRASKSAVNKIMQALATDLEADKICVIAMHPGWVQSDMGGQGADISVAQSAAGILNVANSLDMSDTCQFINWDGKRMDW